jgi:hypothetical protein
VTSISPPPPLTIVKPGEGLAIDPIPGSVGFTFKLCGADTGGAVSIVEHPFPVGECRTLPVRIVNSTGSTSPQIGVTRVAPDSFLAKSKFLGVLRGPFL